MPAIRRDRPPIQGSPALRSRPMFAGQVPADPPAKTIRCDAKDHARPRKYLERNTFSKRSVQVEPYSIIAMMRDARSMASAAQRCTSARSPEAASMKAQSAALTMCCTR